MDLKKAVGGGVRLYEQAREKIKNRTKLAKKLRDEEFIECTFKPTIKRSKRLIKDNEPI